MYILNTYDTYQVSVFFFKVTETNVTSFTEKSESKPGGWVFT